MTETCGPKARSCLGLSAAADLMCHELASEQQKSDHVDPDPASVGQEYLSAFPGIVLEACAFFSSIFNQTSFRNGGDFK